MPLIPLGGGLGDLGYWLDAWLAKSEGARRSI